MIPDFMTSGFPFSWEAVAAWFSVVWVTMMVWGCTSALWWRHAVRYHVQKCDRCRLNRDGSYNLGYDEDGWLVAGTILWPLSIVLLTIKHIFYTPLEMAIRHITTPPEVRAIKEAEFDVVPDEKYDSHEVVVFNPHPSDLALVESKLASTGYL